MTRAGPGIETSPRPLAPSDPAVAFYSLLLEDMFDEWGTKVAGSVLY